MKVTLTNVGIINNSSIVIDGITVITGKNNSGKSTFGKAIYSFISSTENLYENATEDIIEYAKSILTKKFRYNDLSLLFRGTASVFIEKKEIISDKRWILLRDIYNQKYPPFNTLDEMKDYISYIISVIEELDSDFINDIKKYNKFAQIRTKGINGNFDNEKESFINNCYEINELIDKYSDFVEYERKKILFTLIKEFNNQIAPVKIQDEIKSEFKIENDSKEYTFELVEKKQIYSDNGALLFNKANNVVFIDDVTVVDSIYPSLYEERHFTDEEDFEFHINCYDHKLSLMYKLVNRDSIFKSLISEEKYSKIEKIINSVIQDEVTVKDGKFVCQSDNLDLANLAMGSKLFAILQMLLKNGNLDENTILILDEPEAHLHPEWQNSLAEIIAILVKEIGLKVIITSHSPNFVLAIQTFSIKHELQGLTNFYSTKKIDGYRVDYINVNDDLSVIYADFARYFSEVKSIYDNIVSGDNND